MFFQTWMWWIPGLLKRFPGLGVLPSPTNTFVKIEVEETGLHPNSAGHLSAVFASHEGTRV